MLDQFISGKIGTLLKTLSSSSYVNMPKTNEFSQAEMNDNDCIIKLPVKFRVYADTYNQRYRFMTSTYEAWLHFLTLATTPLMPFSYENAFNSVLPGVGYGASLVNDGFNAIKDGISAAGIALGVVKADSSNADALQKFITEIRDLSAKISTLISKAATFGHLVYKLEIPGFIRPSEGIPWIIESFNAKPSAEFLRGTYIGQNSKFIRPKPLYIDFEVNLATNQILTRDMALQLFAFTNGKEVDAAKQKDEPKTAE